AAVPWERGSVNEFCLLSFRFSRARARLLLSLHESDNHRLRDSRANNYARRVNRADGSAGWSGRPVHRLRSYEKRSAARMNPFAVCLGGMRTPRKEVSDEYNRATHSSRVETSIRRNRARSPSTTQQVAPGHGS